MENRIIVDYNKKIAALHEFRLLNSNSVLINDIFKATSPQIQRNKNIKQLLLIAERWDELVSVLNIARYYLQEAIKESYNTELCNSLYSTRMMHLYTANIWYNSTIDFILQFYYLIYSPTNINDNNYENKLRDNKQLNNNIRKQYIPKDELSDYNEMSKKLTAIRNKGNDAKHRRLNILPNKYQNKYGIGILPSFSYNNNGLLHFDDIDITPLSSDKIQQNTDTIDSLVTELINTDNIISTYLKKMETKYIKPIT